MPRFADTLGNQANLLSLPGNASNYEAVASAVAATL